MSTRIAVSATVIIVAGLALGVGYYLGQQRTTATSAASTPVTHEPAATPPSAEPKALDDIAKQTAETRAKPAAIDPKDEVEDFNRNAARTQVLPPSHTTAKKALVGEEVVTVNFKPIEPLANARPDDFIDDNKSPGFFEPLARDAAAGSDAAAHQLWMSLRNCEQAPKTQDELRASLEEAKKRFAQSGGANGVFGTTRTYEEAVGMYQTKYDRCQGVKPKMYDEALQYLREGADRGNSSTLAVEYASSIVKSDPEDARKRNESLWEEGHVAGLAGLGVDSGLGHNSIAHAIAFYAAEIAHIDGIPGSDPASNMFRAKIADLQNQVSPYEYQEAAEEAARLLRSPNCCIEP